MFNKRFLVFVSFIAMIALFLTTGCGGSNSNPKEEVQDQKSTQLIIGSSNLGSFGYTSMEAMANILSKNSSNLKASSISTSGGTENIVLLFNNEIDAGHALSYDFFKANNGTPPYKEKYEPMQLLSYGVLTQLFAVKEGSPYNSLKDLQGKKIAIGPNGSSAATFIKQYLDIAGIEFEPVYLSFEEGKDAFISGMVESVVLPFQNGKPYPVTMQVESALAIRYLDYIDEVNEIIDNSNEGYMIMDIPAGITENVKKDISGPHQTCIIAVRPNMSEDVAYEFTKIIIENVDDLLKISPALHQVKPESVAKGLINDIPIHPGAVKYYKEKGIWEDRLIAGK